MKWIIILLLLIGCTKRDLLSSLEKIKIGDSKISVIQRLGEPNKITKCGKNLWWNTKFLGEDKNHICQYLFWYETGFIERWSIGFDKNDTVISKYHYISE